MNTWALWTVAGHRYAAYTAYSFGIQVVPHHKDGYSWFIVDKDTGAKLDGTPEGFDTTMEDAMRHSEGAFREWLGVIKERAAVVEWLRWRSDDWRPSHLASFIEEGKHRPEGDA